MGSTYCSFVEICKPVSLGRLRANLMHDIARLVGVARTPDLGDFVEGMLLLGYAEQMQFDSWSTFCDSCFDCYYCGISGLTWDHVVPGVADGVPLGTLSVLGNLVPVCSACNTSKGNRPALSWLYERSLCTDEAMVRVLQLAAYQTHYLSESGTSLSGPFANVLLNERLTQELRVLRDSLERIELLALLDRAEGDGDNARPDTRSMPQRLAELQYEAEHLRPLLKRKWDELVLDEYVSEGKLLERDRHCVRLICPLRSDQACPLHPRQEDRLLRLDETGAVRVTGIQQDLPSALSAPLLAADQTQGARG